MDLEATVALTVEIGGGLDQLGGVGFSAPTRT